MSTKSPELFAQRIVTLLNNPTLAQEFGKAGMIHVRQNFRWDVAAKKTLALYSGARVDKIIREAIDEGKFNAEVFELTDIEASLLLNAGYYIEETTEPKKSGNKIIQVTTWTINWESANSISTEVPEEPIFEEPKEPLP